MKYVLFLLLAVLMLPVCTFSQCTWRNIDTLDFENSNIDTSIVPASCYHTSPQTFGVHTGSKGLYFNVQTGVPAGTLLYHRTFNVCPNYPYTFSFYYTTAFATTLCDITVKMYDGNTLINTFISGPVAVQNWLQYSLPNFVPVNSFIKVEIYTNVAGNANGNDLAVDDMVLKGCQHYYSDNVFICTGNSNYNLFDSIPSSFTTSTSGVWSGPSALTGGYLGTYNPNNNVNGNYYYLLAAPSNRCFSDSAAINVNTVICSGACPILTVSNDTAVCGNTQVPLHASINSGTITTVSWSPSTGLNNANIANPVATATGSQQYAVSVTTQSPINLIANGDFSLGNASFTSAYTYVSVSNPPPAGCTSWGLLSCPAYYTIGTNPNAAHSNFSTFGDHTTGTGNMFICNGATNPNITVWQQTVPVSPNTNYKFTCWYANVVSGNPAILAININNTQIGAQFSPSVTPAIWASQTVNWNSGANTTAVLSIQNQSLAAGGNDFVLDDISFNQICVLTDTLHITVNAPPSVQLPADSFFCNTISLNISSVVTGTPAPTLQWQNNSTASTYNASSPGWYWLQVSNVCGTDRDSIFIGLTTSPTSVDLGLNQTICNQAGFIITPTVTGGSAGLNYKWQDSSTTATFNATTSGLYYVRVYNSCGSVWDTVRLTFKTSPTVDLGATLNLCNQNSVTLTPVVTGSPLLNYKWQDSSTTTTYNATTSGLYFVRVYNQCGSVWDTVSVNFRTSPTVDLGLPQSLCNQNSLTLTPVVSGTAVLNYKWQDSTTTTTYNATTSGLYFVRVYNMCGSVWDTVTITFVTGPSINLGVDTTICTANSFTIVPVVSGATPISYLWQGGTNTGSTYTTTFTGPVICVATNACGSSADTVTITFMQPPVVNFVQHQYVVCENTPIVLNPSITGSSPWTFNWSNGVNSVNQTITNTGLYTLTVNNICGSAQDTVNLKVIPQPYNIYNGQSFEICDTTKLLLDAENSGAQYHWSTGEFTKTISVNTTGVYYVQITNYGLCETIDSVKVKTIDCRPGNVMIPTAFTPNRDGLNDFFKPFILGENAHLVSFQIFNRWGQLVYETNQENAGWDGTFKGTDQPIDVYIFVVRWKQFDEDHVLKGDLTLLR